MTDAPSGAIDRRRLRRAGAPGADALDWATRLGAAAMLLAVLWTGWSALRPLPTPPEREAAAPSIVAPDPPIDARPPEERRALLAELARTNLFASDRLAWKPKVEPAPAEADPASPSPAPAQASLSPTVKSDPSLTPADKVPDDVKKALSALELRGLRTGADGRAVAMISRVHGTSRSASSPYHEGDEFEEESNKQAKWKVTSIDWAGRRVLLTRSGVTVALALYTSEAVGVASAAARAAEPGSTDAAPSRVLDPERTGIPGAPAVAIRSREEAIDDLRRAGVSEEDIAQVLRALDAPLVKSAQADAQPPIPVTTPATDDPTRRTPPPGMEAVLKLMQEQSKATGSSGQEPAPQPKRRPRSRPRPGN
ncbi:MAG TPA: hypothetical protein DEB06_05070 [Phycisphaerales bacterium]|nr:hypothetical protein [Phycisphaerales bacterium]